LLNSEFGCVSIWFNSTALRPGKAKTIFLQKAMAQLPWTANKMATARNAGTAN
jgi:hypothetical protein